MSDTQKSKIAKATEQLKQVPTDKLDVFMAGFDLGKTVSQPSEKAESK